MNNAQIRSALPNQYNETIKVHPSVIFQLGNDLITDDVQALIELVKNAYDADSKSASVIVDTDIWTDYLTGVELDEEEVEAQLSDPRRRERERPLRGKITVSDRGTGMRIEQIIEGWLTVSGSHKKLMKEQGKTTDLGRVPMGDKGLGRLGVQRLGRVLRLTTVPRLTKGEQREDVPGLTTIIDWSDYARARTLEDVNVSVNSIDPTQIPVGTRLEICGLHSPDLWSSGTGTRLESDLISLISPYDDNRGFRVSIQVNGRSVDLRERTRSVLEAAQLSYNLTYNKGILEVQGQISLEYIEPVQGQDKIDLHRRIIVEDNGRAFLKWLFATQTKRCKDNGLTPDYEHGRIRVHQNFPLDDILASLESDSGPEAAAVLADPGQFTAQIDMVPLKKDPTSVFKGVSEYRSFVRGLQGIRVYRNGFGIKLPSDWLKLSSQWTGATSWYTIRPENSLGHIDLTAEHNSALEETTNREAFRDTPAYRGFMRVLAQWIKGAGLAQEVVGRGYVEYAKIQAESLADVPSGSSPGSLVRQAINSVAARAEAPTNQQIRQQLEMARRKTEKLTAANQQMNTTLFVDEDHSRATQAGLEELKASLEATAAAIPSAEDSVKALERERRTLELLQSQVELLQTQLTDAWELVSLGLSTEAVSHEIRNITDSLRTRTQAVQKHLTRANIKDEAIWQYTDSVAGTATALSKQLSRLDPAMRYVRETKKKITLASAASEAAKHFNFRWSGRPLSVEVRIEEDFTVQINPGKVSQVLDNLILNSEYWLSEELRMHPSHRGQVQIRVRRPFLYISDSGPGIDSAVEELLFEPFITTKPASEGRGLGLFVVKQLLGTDGVLIELTSERNDRGRRNTFRIDFSSVTEA